MIKDKFYDKAYFNKTINRNCDYYIKDKDGNNQLVFSFKKNAIDKKIWNDVIEKIYDKNILHSSNRKIETSDEKKESLSGIIGYFNTIPSTWKAELPFKWAGRKTKYTRLKKKNFKEIVKIAELVQNIYKQSFPDIFSHHQKESSKIIPDLKIGNTVFTTCTLNKDLRTSAHRDKGDLSDVLSCILCLGKGFTGGYLGFPEYKVCVKLQPGDLILMNSKELHSNTELILKTQESVRYSLVFYTRHNMGQFKNKVRVNTVSDYVYLNDKDYIRYKQLQKK